MRGGKEIPAAGQKKPPKSLPVKGKTNQNLWPPRARFLTHSHMPGQRGVKALNGLKARGIQKNQRENPRR